MAGPRSLRREKWQGWARAPRPRAPCLEKGAAGHDDSRGVLKHRPSGAPAPSPSRGPAPSPGLQSGIKSERKTRAVHFLGFNVPNSNICL